MKREIESIRTATSATAVYRACPIALAIVSVIWTAQAAASNSPAQSWDFERELTDWTEPGGGSGIVVEPGRPANHVYRIVATQPHHTRLVFEAGRRWPDFVAACRFRTLSRQGEPSAVYLYGRQNRGGFRGLSIHGPRARVFCWNGKDGPNPTVGEVTLPAPDAAEAWTCAKFACYRDHLFAKVWPDGSPEPPAWQIAGKATGTKTGGFAIGAWTSPRTPSRAEALIDDVSFRPLSESDLAPLRLRVHPRKPFDLGVAARNPGAFVTPDLAGLATAETVVAFDAETGEFAHAVHRDTGRDFISLESFRPLFKLTLTKPYEGKTQTTTSAAFREVTVRAENETRLALSFAKHVSLPLTARVTATTGDDGLVRFRLSIANDSDWAVGSVAFPLAGWPGRLGQDGDDDRLVLPWSGGSVLHGPGRISQSRSAVYPGLSFAQFTALYDPTAGLYLAAYDPDGHCKRWDLRTTRDVSVHMDLVHLRPEVAQRNAGLDYDVVLTTFTGDWRDAADLYKQWARRQTWCRKALTERTDIPAFLKTGAGVLIDAIQNEAGRTKRYGPELERLPDVIARYRDRTGLSSIIFVPYGWENRGTWAGIHYLPAVPSNDVWVKVNAALRAQGDRTAFMTSGFWWVVKRQQTRNGPAFDDTADFRRRSGMVIHKADGTPWQQDNYEKVKTFGDWRGLSVKLCHGSRDACDTMRRIFLDVARLGTPLISFDQEIGGGQRTPCYAKDHGHPPGYGPWMWTGFRDLCAEIIEQGKAIQPELGLFLENTSELAIPWMSTYWSRQFGEVDHGAANARGIGLFSYLYHEYVTAIGAACVQGQGARGTRPSASLRCRVLANNLVRGLIPGPFMGDVPLETTDPWRTQVARAYFAYCRPYARFPEYLVLGRTCRPPVVTCAAVNAHFYRANRDGAPIRPGGPKVVKVPVTLPAVIAGSFAAADGSVGTVIVNTTGESQAATIALAKAAEIAILYEADRREARRYDRPSAGQQIRVSLEPFGVRMLVAR